MTIHTEIQREAFALARTNNIHIKVCGPGTYRLWRIIEGRAVSLGSCYSAASLLDRIKRVIKIRGDIDETD